MKYTANTIENQTTNNSINAISKIHLVNNSPSLSSSASSSASSTSSRLSTSSTTNCGESVVSATSNPGNALFSEQVNTVTSLFEKWNDCERTVVMYALLKRLHYPSLKFLQYSIGNTLTQNMDPTSNLSTIVVDMNANNPSYLQNLLNAYKTSQAGDLVDTLSSSSSDKDSLPCYGSDFQITHCDDRKLYSKKEDILHEVLNMLPLLKPGNEEAKIVYLSLIPLAVKDTIRQIVPTELVQQIFSYMLIHPAVLSDDRRNLNCWLRHLEDHLQNYNNCPPFNIGMTTANCSLFQIQNNLVGGLLLDNTTMTTSGSSAASSTSSAISLSSTASNASAASTSFGNLTQNCNSTAISNNSSIVGTRNNDWQTIQPPSKQQQQHLTKSTVGTDWPSLVPKPSPVANQTSGNISNGVDSSIIAIGSAISDQLCDNLNGITLNDIASSQNSLGLNIVVTSMVDPLATVDGNVSSLVDGVAAAAASATAASVTTVDTTPNIFGPQTNPIINIINNNQNCSGLMTGIEDHDTSFSKNGTEILDFDPNTNAINSCDGCNSNSSVGHPHQQQMEYASILMSNCAEHLDITRWNLDSKFAALKTRRSNSLTTQTLSSSASSSNSSVITVNDNCSNSTENLAQFANKPRSFSLSIEHHRGSLTNSSGSDTRLDDFKPNYIKFQTRNVGMSSIGLWLKSLRLHKYIELFKNMTYEDMLQITEEYLQSLGVTKGASHKLALCIEKLKDRSQNLIKMEQELINGQLKLQAAVEELANIVLTPMKPIELLNSEDNIGLNFLKVVDIVCTIAQKDPYTAIDDDNISVILWILDRSIHNEAFINHVNQLKELKFKLSKLKMSLTPKIHHTKNGSNSSLNKPRWNGKTRKCEQKNGSNDRINHRKNSNDMLNFSLSCLQHQHHHNQQVQQQQQQHQQQINEYDKYQNNNNNNNSNNNNNNQFKNSAYQNYQQQQIQHQQMQQHQLQPQTLQQNTHFTVLPQQQHQQHRRSLNNLIVVSGGPQQPQKMIFKPGQGILSNTNMTTNDDLTIEMMKSNQQQQCRKASLTSTTNNSIVNNDGSNMETQHQQQQSASVNSQMQNNPMTMVSNDDLMHTAATTATATAAAAASTTANVSGIVPPPPPPQILITNNNTPTNHVLLQQQHHALQKQQQQLQLLAAAAAAVGNSCSQNLASLVNNCSSTNNSNNANVGLVVANINNNNSSSSSNIVLQQCNSICSTTNNNNNCGNSNSLSSCNNCNNHQQLQINLKLPPLNEDYQHHSPPTISDVLKTTLNNTTDPLNDFSSLEQLETLCLQMTEQAIN